MKRIALFLMTNIAIVLVQGITLRILDVLASIIVMWFSRQREFRADAGGASLSSREKMASALERLKSSVAQPHLPDQLAAFGISGGPGHGIKRLFMSHPPLDERIHRLRSMR